MTKSLDTTYWLERWKNNQLGFHMDEEHPFLREFWSDHIGKAENVLVPLCGKATCLHYLAKHNKNVFGVEFSEVAVRSFFEESNLKAIVKKLNEESKQFNNQNITLQSGDFYKIEPQSFDAFYDRAALIAIPKHEQHSYLKYIQSLINKRAKGLLITLEYQRDQGPPYSTSLADIDNLCSGLFDVKHLKSTKTDNTPTGEGTEHVVMLEKLL